MKKLVSAIKKSVTTILNNRKFPCTVRHFSYNGFFVEVLPEETNYKARFIRWTNDPGIAIMACSDGKERAIPSCAVVVGESDFKEWPKQIYNDKILFGYPSNSK